MPSLLDSGQGDPGNPITSLLGSVGSALSGGVAQPSDTQASMASFLAAASAMANAGAPTLGPPQTNAQAVLGALGAGRQAAVANEILPFVQRQAAMAQQEQQLDYETKLFNFQRQNAYYNLVKGGAAPASTDASGGAPAAPPPSSSSPPAPGQPQAALGMRQNNPGNLEFAGQPGALATTNNRFAVFPDMPTGVAANANQLMINQDVHGYDTVRGQITHWVNDPKANLTGLDSNGKIIPNVNGTAPAAGSYIGDVSRALGVDPDTTVDWHDPGNLSKFILAMQPHESGPTALDPHDVTAGVQLALNPGKPYRVAQAGSGVQPPPTAPAASGAASAAVVPPAARMVPDLLSPGLQVPYDVEQAAITAGRAAPNNPMEAHAGVIKDYFLKKSLMPTYAPTATPGVQVSSQGETSAAPQGTVTLSPPTADERKSMFPQVPAWQDILLKRDQTGRVVGYELPDMGPEPVKPISDAQAQLPSDQGGAGESYRPKTAFTVGTRTGVVKPVQIERGSGVPTGDGSVTPGQITLQGQQFQQAQQAENQIINSPVYTNWNQGAQKYDAVLTSLNQHNRVGDQAALESLAKVFDPSAVVTEGKLAMASNYGGIQQVLQNWLGSITGDAGLPDSVRAQIANLATAEMKTRDTAVMGQIQRSRASAAAKGVNPANVMPLFQTQALTAGDPEAKGAPAGVQLAQPYVLQNGQYVRQEPAAPPPKPTTTAPVTAAPAATPPALPAPGAVTPSGLQAVPDAQFKTWLPTIKRGQYSDQELGQIIAEKRRRGL